MRASGFGEEAGDGGGSWYSGAWDKGSDLFSKGKSVFESDFGKGLLQAGTQLYSATQSKGGTSAPASTKPPKKRKKKPRSKGGAPVQAGMGGGLGVSPLVIGGGLAAAIAAYFIFK